jgi:hypothetical protein
VVSIQVSQLKVLCIFVPHTCYMPRPSYSRFITRTISGRNTNHAGHYEISPHSTVTSSLLSPNIFLSTLFSNTPSLCFSRSMRDQVSHPYKIGGQIIVLISDYNLEISTLQLCMISSIDNVYLLSHIVKVNCISALC